MGKESTADRIVSTLRREAGGAIVVIELAALLNVECEILNDQLSESEQDSI
jgi:hypothetical protein